MVLGKSKFEVKNDNELCLIISQHHHCDDHLYQVACLSCIFSDGSSLNGETKQPSGENVAPSNHVVNKNRVPPGTQT